MRPRRIRTLGFALTCALASHLAGAQLPDGVRLKLEHQLHMAPPRLERDSAKFLEADRVEAQGRDKVVASGNVVLRQLGAAIRADRVEYDAKDQTATATGHVQIDRNGDKASGPHLLYRLDNGTGEMDTPVFELPKTAERRIATRGDAARAELEQEQKSRLFGAEYTSCPVPRDDWFLRVKELDVDGSRNVGAAYNSTLYFLGVPILYMPYVSFPLDNKRRSGFLAPTFGTSGRSGLEASLPYYWNIAENLDTTITPKVFTKRGIQIGDEFRYLEPKLSGQLDAEFLPNDRLTGSNRWFVGLHHAQQFGHGWSAAVNTQEVSDDNYFRDLSTKIALTSQTNLPHDAAVAYNDDTWSFVTRALSYQTLQDPNGPPVPVPYRILPQVTFAGSGQNVHGLDWQLTTEASNFSHPTLVEGQRFILNPSVSMPLRRSYGYVVPKIEYYYMRYALHDHGTSVNDEGPLSVPIASVDSGLYFDRAIDWGGRAFDQTLEPRLYYLYVPFRDQSRLPNFTTAEKDFSFAQIFTDNRFVGGDRVGDANQITLGLTSRMIESATGLERFTASIGQVYYFQAPRVSLGLAPAATKHSDLLAGFRSQMSPSVTLDAGFQYTPNLNRSEKIVFEGRYSPVPGSVVNVAYRYARGTTDPFADPSVQAGIEQVDLSAQWPITREISGVGRWNWSLQDRKLVEGLAGFEYNAGCWQLRAVAHRFITSTQQYSTSFQIQLELTGFSRIGINPLETLRQNIPGYRRSDEISP
ncbi:MAG TPA: LPS-assembly protein LptD [Usitatibacter sp.]|nr:LPS-assembly protein LptD [Usitatibacter sp.]